MVLMAHRSHSKLETELKIICRIFMAHRSHSKRKTKMKIKCLNWFSVSFLFYYILFYFYFTSVLFFLSYFTLYFLFCFIFFHVLFNFMLIFNNLFLLLSFFFVIFMPCHLDFWQMLCILMSFSYENAWPPYRTSCFLFNLLCEWFFDRFLENIEVTGQTGWEWKLHV